MISLLLSVPLFCLHARLVYSSIVYRVQYIVVWVYENVLAVFSMRNSCIMIMCLLIHVQDGRTPLYIASGKGHGAVVKLLLEQHADVSISKTVRCKWANINGYVFITTVWLDSTNGSII